MKRFRNALAPMAILLGLTALVGLSGCTEDGSEWQRLVCEVQSVNGGEPLIIALVDYGSDGQPGGGDDSQPIEYAEVAFHARPYNSSITSVEDYPYSYFHVTGYDLIWHPLSPGSEAMAACNIYNAGVDVLVPVNDEAAVSILIGDPWLKSQSWFQDLSGGGTLSATCELRFHGHETGSDKTIDVVGSLTVVCVGAVTGD